MFLIQTKKNACDTLLLSLDARHFAAYSTNGESDTRRTVVGAHRLTCSTAQNGAIRALYFIVENATRHISGTLIWPIGLMFVLVGHARSWRGY